MDPRINTFCRSHFSRQEKRGFFFPVQPRTCHTCHRPKDKKHIDFDNFSNYHQNLTVCVLNQLIFQEVPEEVMVLLEVMVVPLLEVIIILSQSHNLTHFKIKSSIQLIK